MPQILGDIIENWRFSVMKENRFINVKRTNLLTKQETRDVWHNFADSRWPVQFLQHERRYNSSAERRVLYRPGQIWDIFD